MCVCVLEGKLGFLKEHCTFYLFHKSWGVGAPLCEPVEIPLVGVKRDLEEISKFFAELESLENH